VLQNPSGKRKVGELEASTPDSGREKKKARDESVPTEDEDLGNADLHCPMIIIIPLLTHVAFVGPGRRRSKAVPEPSPSSIKRFQAVITMLHSQISQHRNGNIFHNPIKDSEAPDYHEIVKRPMDLKTMKTRIKDGAISNSDEYQREIYLMFANAMMYNRPKSDIYRMAREVSHSSHSYSLRGSYPCR
jgi:bromodomain-containing protein 8